MRGARLLIAGLFIVLPGVVLAPLWGLAGLGAGEDDILYYFPLRVFFAEAVASGEWPWLLPWSGLDRPLTADPQAALWYPTTWLFALVPPLVAYPASLWLHFTLALWGMYLLLRAEGLRRSAAVFGAVAFGFCGFMLAHRVHFTMQHAAAWTPWVFWALRRYVFGATAGRRCDPVGRRLAVAAVVIALQAFAGHVQITLLATGGALLWLVALGWRARHPAWSGILTRWVLVGICAAGLYAVQWLPTALFLRDTTRTERTYFDFVENSLSPAALLGWVSPMIFGQRTPNFFPESYWGPSHQVEQFGYMGWLTLILGCYALRFGGRWQPARRGWFVLGVGGLLTAIGYLGPVCPVLYLLPGSSLFRCPARALLLVNLAFAALAAYTVQDLVGGRSPRRSRVRAALQGLTRRPWVPAVVLAGLPPILLLPVVPWLGEAWRGVAFRSILPWSPAVWVPLIVGLVSLGVLAWAVRGGRTVRHVNVLLVVLVADLAIIGWTLDMPRGVRTPQELTAPQGAAAGRWMDLVRASGARLWVVNGRVGWLPGEYVQPVEKAVANTNVLRRIRTLTDYGPLQPRGYAARFGFKPWGESERAAELLAETSWARLYNVGWILLCDPSLPAPDMGELVALVPPDWRLFALPETYGDALFEDATVPGSVRYRETAPHSFCLRVDSWSPDLPPAETLPPQQWPRVVIARAWLKGWNAQGMGRRVHIERVDDVLMGVRVPPGVTVDIVFQYTPPGLQEGILVSVAFVVLLGWAALSGRCGSVLTRVNSRRRPSANAV